MRANDLIGQEVLDRDGRRVGLVSDLRCVQDGPLRGAMQAPRIEALLVSTARMGAQLGYDRRDQQGPWLIRVVVRRLHRNLLIVPWSDVDDYAGPVRLKTRSRTPG